MEELRRTIIVKLASSVVLLALVARADCTQIATPMVQYCGSEIKCAGAEGAHRQKDACPAGT